MRGLLPEGTMVSLRASGGWGGRYNWFLSFFFFLSFRTGDGMGYVRNLFVGCPREKGVTFVRTGNERFLKV